MTCLHRSALMYIPAETTSNCWEFSPGISEEKSVATGCTLATPSRLKMIFASSTASPVKSPWSLT